MLSFPTPAMKRTLAALVTLVLFLTIVPDAFAQSLGVNPTRWNQPRISARALKQASYASYWHRWDLAYRRERYRNIVARVMQGIPATLAVTGGGGRTHPDYLIIDRPTARTIRSIGWRLSSHCIDDADRFNDVSVSGKEFCSQAD